MGHPLIRRAGGDDAFLVAALHLQLARDLGMPAESGFLDRFAEQWHSERLSRPTWIAEVDGEHGGIVETLRTRALPWPGRATASRLRIEALYVPPRRRGAGIATALASVVIDWARTSDIESVRLDAPDEHCRRLWVHLGFGNDTDGIVLRTGAAP